MTHRKVIPTSKYYMLLILIVITNSLLFTQSSREIELSGKSSNGLDTIILLELDEDPHYQGIKIPIEEDSSFHYTLQEAEVKEYNLVLQSDHQNGAYRPTSFFTDSDKIEFEVFDLASNTNSIVKGSKYTDLLGAFRKEFEEVWMKKFASVMQASSSLPKMQANYKRDSLIKEMITWQYDKLTAYPKEIQLSMFYRDLRNHEENTLLRDVLIAQAEKLHQLFKNNSLLDAVDDKLQVLSRGLINEPFKDFYLHGQGKDSVKVSDVSLVYRFVLLDMWSPWCGPCIKKSRIIASKYEYLTQNGVQVIGIVGGIGSLEDYVVAARRHQYPWNLYHEIDNHQSIWQKYGLENSGGGQVLVDVNGMIKAINPTFEEISEIVGK